MFHGPCDPGLEVTSQAVGFHAVLVDVVPVVVTLEPVIHKGQLNDCKIGPLIWLYQLDSD